MRLAIAVTATVFISFVSTAFTSKDFGSMFGSTEVDIISASSVYSCTDQSAYERTAESLEKFYGHLKAFCTTGDFLVNGFDWAAKKLEKLFSKTSNAVDSLQPCGRIMQQFQFVSGAFYTMSGYLLFSKNDSPEADESWLIMKDLIKLNVALYGMYDSKGQPVFQSKDYALNVYKSFEVLHHLEDEYWIAENVTSEDSKMFEKLFDRATKALLQLESHVTRAS